MDNYASRQFAFIEFVLQQYVKEDVSELDDERIGKLINLKYGSPTSAKNKLGEMTDIRSMFCSFQQYLHQKNSQIKVSVCFYSATFQRYKKPVAIRIRIVDNVFGLIEDEND